MNSIKTILLSFFAGVMVVGLFAFKTETAVKEYCTVTKGVSNFTIVKPGGEKSKFPTGGDFEVTHGKMLNELAKEGWELEQIYFDSGYGAIWVLVRDKQ